MKVYVVVEALPEPRIIDVFRNKTEAEAAAGKNSEVRLNIVEKELE